MKKRIENERVSIIHIGVQQKMKRREGNMDRREEIYRQEEKRREKEKEKHSGVL